MTHQKSLTIRLHPDDNVVVDLSPLEPQIEIPDENMISRDRIPESHKVATREIQKDEPIVKYGQVIGAASKDIKPGEHVHSHNMEMLQYDRNYTFGAEAGPTRHVSEGDQAFFQGIVRPDGRVATRNFIGVMASCGCSAGVARFIAEAFNQKTLAPFPNVDGVVHITHSSGCGIADHGDGIEYLQRTLAGWARHPNFAGSVLVGHGCEINQIDDFTAKMNLISDPTFCSMNVQSAGGTTKSVQQGIEAVQKMLPMANQVERQPVPASHLVIGLECGGSDGLSGITANPALGVASDLLVRQGGTVILSETTEIYGAEQLLVGRAGNEGAARKLLERVQWWEDYVKRNGIELNNNPSPGNKAGGLTTILEKSLGAVAKSGSTNLVEVYRFAEPVTAKGLVFMDTPGYDLVSVTGMIAGGANMICFTTGRGSVFGSKPVPTIKLATNSKIFHAMEEDMDINCGVIVDGEASLEETGAVIFQKILATASGAKTKSELLGFGADEFVPWHLGAIL
jgi:arabinonate dehydratase